MTRLIPRRIGTIAVWAAMGLLACASPNVPQPRDAGDTGADAGQSSVDAGQAGVDSGTVVDAGDFIDAGESVPDSGTSVDEGTIVDAGESAPDSGTSVDAGENSPDAGQGNIDAGESNPDAGQDTIDAGEDALDAGSEVDAGPFDAGDPCSNVTCTAPDACHTAGTCDPGTGACVGGTSLLTELAGNYTITDATSADALVCVEQIGGKLTIDGDSSLPTVHLPFLEQVGALAVTAGSQVSTLSLEGLATVTGMIDLESNPALTTVALGSLTSAGSVYVAYNTGLTSLDLTGLGQTGSIDLLSNPVLANLGDGGLGQLRSVTHGLTVRSNPMLASFGPQGLSNLRTAGNIDLESNTALTSLGPTSLTELTMVAGLLDIEQSPLLTDVDVGGAVLGGFYLVNVPALQSFKLANLPSSVSYAVIQNAPKLSDLGPTGLSPLQTVEKDLIVVNTALPFLGPMGISGLVSVGHTLDLESNPKLSSLGPTNLTQLTAVGQAQAGGFLDVEQNPLITSIDVGNAVLGGFYLMNNAALQTFHVGNLPANIVYAVIANSPLLDDLGPGGMSPLQTVTKDLKVVNTALSGLGPTGISSLVSVGHTLDIESNAKLASLGPDSLTRLTAVGQAQAGGVLDVEQNPLLSVIDVGSAVLGGFYITSNTALKTLQLGMLPADVSEAVIANAPMLNDLGSVGLSPIQTVTKDLQVANTGLASLGPKGISGLISVGHTLDIERNPSLSSLGPASLTQLTAVGRAQAGGILDVEQNAALTGVDVGSAILGGFYVANNSALKSLNLGNLPANLSQAVIVSTPLLSDLGPIGLSSVQTVEGNFSFEYTALTSLGPSGISNLVSVGGTFAVDSNAQLASLGPTSLKQLTSIGGGPNGGGFDLESNSVLTAVDASSLSSVTGPFVVNNNAQLSQLALTSLITLAGNLQITNNPKLPTCFAPLLAQLVGYSGMVTINSDGPACQ